ncbi:MAG: acetate--CoA ligase [Candidatus Kapabacteria bacterium]|nr:acetate--CoA ligase [Candidatus Kapabacteria bacterium]
MASRSAKSGAATSADTSDRISSVLQEHRAFAPPASFRARAHVSSARQLASLRAEAEADPVAFWQERAKELAWFRPWKKVLDWKHPHARWFVGGTTNASVNCLDRHLGGWRRTKAALIWEGEMGEVRTMTYQQLHGQVCKAANALLKLGVQRGDVVAIYMGMVPETVIAMLACARIGATHNVIFGGFSSEAVRERINDSGAVVLITQDAAVRRGSIVELKSAADVAVKKCPSIRHMLVLSRCGVQVTMKRGRDLWWHDVVDGASPVNEPAQLDSEHPLFILYTSGSTGKPKGILHTTGGYLTQVAYTTRMVFDLQEDDVYFCTADVGWITGHSYVVYGPLMNGATVMIYEGVPNYPAPDRMWDIVERHAVSVFYTAPTAIRSFMKAGQAWPERHDLSSLRLLGTVGEPINPEAWMWYHSVIGKGRCPIVDTWWQTETGAIMISPLPGATTTRPGTATVPLPGIVADVVRKDGTSCGPNEGGLLVIKHPWPSMLRTIHGNDERYKAAYWSEFPKGRRHPGWYFTGDGARRDRYGNIWIIGRVDDVVNVSGHRLGTAEIESALVSDPRVAEAAVVARPDDIKGNALVAFVTVKVGVKASGALAESLRQHVGKEIGPIAKPDEIRFTDALPKTRSGKIMRRLLREIVTSGSATGDVTTLEDSGVLERLRSIEEE